MSVWLSYKHFEGTIDFGRLLRYVSCCGFTCGGTASKTDFKDFQLVKFGALINF